MSETAGALLSAVETHVREVDQAETPVPPADPIVAPTFSTALTSTPCDAAVLAGGVALDEPPAPTDGASEPPRKDLATEANVAAPARDGNATVRVPVSTDDAENDASARATTKPSSVAAMRARKFAGSAKPARPALREVNR